MRIQLAPIVFGSVLLGTGLSCSGGSGGGGGSTPDATFRLIGMSVSENSVWQINRPMEFEFSMPVNFLTVSSNTINIQKSDGTPATGSFYQKPVDADGDGVFESIDETTVVFQPNCPTAADLSDAGLQPGGEYYTITIDGAASTSNTVKSIDAHTLAQTEIRTFSTPNSTNSAIAFMDTRPGPPVPIVRPTLSTTTKGVTYVEVGRNADPATRMFFEFDSTLQEYSVKPGKDAASTVPLNLYSDSTTAAAVVIEFNQAVNPSGTNISNRRLRLEYQDAAGDWQPIDTRVELISNCSRSGATVRLEPLGLLPGGSYVRAVVLPGFQDIYGEFTSAELNRFAVAPTDVINNSGLMNPSDGADEFLEEFNFGGAGIESFQSTTAVFDTPEAVWNNGKLTAAFDFSGNGGPGGDFDWHIRKNQIIILDTSYTEIIGGPGGVAKTTQGVINGIVDVRNLVIEQGGELRVQGPNPMQLNATGYVRIDGRLNANGFNAKDVATLDTGNQAEIGGAGGPAGGVGGKASERLTTTTPRGGTGGGPFGETNTGGQGGESGYAKESLGKDARRPGGGGGGRFAADYDKNPGLRGSGGTYAQNGYPGHALCTGSLSKIKPAPGGNPGVGPFKDATTENDFFGIKPIVSLDASGTATIDTLVRGELTRLWAGYGGGGAGDACPATSFPTPRWKVSSDEKGGGGGGGGGSIRIRALGQIIFGRIGVIDVQGGQGGTGENTYFLDHIGGTGGSGSGGHVLLESAVRIDFTNGAPATALKRIYIDARGARKKTGTLSDAPKNVSHGGGGGPGVVQFHVPSIQPYSNDPDTSDIVVPTVLMQVVNVEPMSTIVRPPGIPMIPTFGARSKAQSRWISVGGAYINPSGGNDLIKYVFGGTETVAGPDYGKILTTFDQVTPLPPLIGPRPISATAKILPDDVTIRLYEAEITPLLTSTATVSTDIYLRTPALLHNFAVELVETGNPTNSLSYSVISAQYNNADKTLDLTLDSAVKTVGEFTASISAEYSLIPRFFRVRTDGLPDYLPSSAFVKIFFEGARDDGFGNPDEANLLVSKTANIDDFNGVGSGELQFFRFEVEFDLDAAGNGVTPETKPISLDFLRIPFRF